MFDIKFYSINMHRAIRTEDISKIMYSIRNAIDNTITENEKDKKLIYSAAQLFEKALNEIIIRQNEFKNIGEPKEEFEITPEWVAQEINYGAAMYKLRKQNK